MTAADGFSLRRWSLSCIAWYFSVVAGWATIVVSLAHLITTSSIKMVPAFVMMAALIVLLELCRSCRAAVTTRRAWSCRPRSPARCCSSGVPGRRSSWSPSRRSRRTCGPARTWWKIVFNPAQYALSVGARLPGRCWPSPGSPVAQPTRSARSRCADLRLDGRWRGSRTSWSTSALVAGACRSGSRSGQVVLDDFVALRRAMTFARAGALAADRRSWPRTGGALIAAAARSRCC